jgi:hypothetical protein
MCKVAQETTGKSKEFFLVLRFPYSGSCCGGEKTTRSYEKPMFDHPHTPGAES